MPLEFRAGATFHRIHQNQDQIYCQVGFSQGICLGVLVHNSKHALLCTDFYTSIDEDFSVCYCILLNFIK